MRAAPLLGLALSLAACDASRTGSTPARGQVASPSSVAPGLPAPSGPGRWNAADICTALDRGTVARLLGGTVTAVRRESLSTGENGAAVTSRCAYLLADGASLWVVAREVPSPEAILDAIEDVRTGHDGVLPAPRAVPNLGRAAFWGGMGDQLQVFLNEQRFLVITLHGLPPGDRPRERAIAVARHFL